MERGKGESKKHAGEAKTNNDEMGKTLSEMDDSYALRSKLQSSRNDGAGIRGGCVGEEGTEENLSCVW